MSGQQMDAVSAPAPLVDGPKAGGKPVDRSKGLWTRCDKCGVILYVKHLKVRDDSGRGGPVARGPPRIRSPRAGVLSCPTDPPGTFRSTTTFASGATTTSRCRARSASTT